jgi:glycosyltransferase involved in cell wall biosynthesis
MKIAFLTTDNREQQNQYEKSLPFFGPAPTAVLEGFAQLSGEVEVHVISCTRRAMPGPRKLADNIWFHQPVVPHIGWGRTLFLGCVSAVRKVLGGIQPDLVHGQGTERDCAMSAVLSGYPNVLTIHGIMRAVAEAQGAKLFSYYGLASLLEHFAVGRTAGVFCNSAYTESRIAPLARQTWRVPNCIRGEFFSPLPDETSRKRRIVVLGSIIHYKQSLEVLRMWSGLAERHPGVVLTFVGRSGSDRYSQDFRDLLNDPVLRGRVEYIEWLEVDDLIPLLDSARGMIHFPTEESFGLVVAEGLARNLKLFASRTGGVPDVAEGCDGVEYFAANDWHRLSRSVSRWVEEGMPVVNSNSTIASRFSPVAVASKHLEIYRSVLNR